MVAAMEDVMMAHQIDRITAIALCEALNRTKGAADDEALMAMANESLSPEKCMATPEGLEGVRELYAEHHKCVRRAFYFYPVKAPAIGDDTSVYSPDAVKAQALVDAALADAEAGDIPIERFQYDPSMSSIIEPRLRRVKQRDAD